MNELPDYWKNVGTRNVNVLFILYHVSLVFFYSSSHIVNFLALLLGIRGNCVCNVHEGQRCLFGFDLKWHFVFIVMV